MAITTLRTLSRGTLALAVLAAGALTACDDDDEGLTAPGEGVIQVITVTTGEQPDPDGYDIIVDGGEPRPTGSNATLEITGLQPGEHTVELTGVAGNCTPDATSQTVSVTGATPVQVTFNILCVHNGDVGTVNIITNSFQFDSVSDVDTSFTVTLSNGFTGTIGAIDTLVVDSVLTGPLTVELGDVASNCDVDGGTTQTIEVLRNGIHDVVFNITCTGPAPAHATRLLRGRTHLAAMRPGHETPTEALPSRS